MVFADSTGCGVCGQPRQFIRLLAAGAAPLLGLLFLAAAQTASAEDFTQRIALLRHHVERLHAITVPEGDEAAKDEKLKLLDTALSKNVTNKEEFDALYGQVDEVRMWLWAHAKDRPQTSAGSFVEAGDAWTITAPLLTVTLAKSDLALSVKTPKASWKFAPCDDRDIVMPGRAVGLRAAGKRTVEEFRTGYSEGLLAVFGEFDDIPGLEVRLCLNIVGNRLVCEFVATDEGLAYT